MDEDFDLFSNINNLDEILSRKPAQYDSPVVSDPPSPVVTICDSPPRARGATKALSKSSATEIPKKGNQVMKRIQKKQEVVQRKTQKMMAPVLSLMNHSSSSTSKSNSASRFRRRRYWARRRSSDHESDYADNSYINIGSPAETNSSFSGNASGSHSVSVSSVDLSSDIDYEVTIKLKWNGTIERIPYWQNKNFEDLFKMLSERAGAEQDRIFLMMNDSIVKPTDSPNSIGYTSVDFISGRVMENEVMTSKKSKKSKTEIKLKIQSDRWKRPIVVSADKRDTVRDLLQKCAQELKCSTDEITLRFDGDILDLASTLQESELEGGEILDCVFKGGRKN